MKWPPVSAAGALRSLDASDADVIEQAIEVPIDPDDERDSPETAPLPAVQFTSPMVMQSLERRLERMVTGVFSRGSRTNIRPIELGRRLVREMDDQRSVDVKGRRVVPNDFAVQLSSKDFEGFTEIAEVLQTELVEAAREYARSEGYHFLGPVRVELAVDDAQKPGRFDVLATLRQGANGGAPARLPWSCRRASVWSSATPGHRRAAVRVHDPAQRQQRQPAPRRDPPQPAELRRRRPRFDQRHDGQRHAHLRRDSVE